MTSTDPAHRGGDELVDRAGGLYPAGLRSVARGAALSMLSTLYRLSGRRSAGLARPRVHFLYLHHVFADEEQAFRRLLAHLSGHAEFVGYSDAVERVLSGRLDRSYVSLSFDDGLQSCVRAARVMDEFGAKGCFFIVPSIIGERDAARLREFCSRRLQMPPVEFMTWHEVDALLADDHEVGSHTVNHARISALSRERMQDEIGRSRTMIEEKAGPIRHFSWPFGMRRHFNEALREWCRTEGGFTSVSSAIPTLQHAWRGDPHDVPRTRWHLARGVDRNLEELAVDGRLFERVTGRSPVG